MISTTMPNQTINILFKFKVKISLLKLVKQKKNKRLDFRIWVLGLYTPQIK